MKFTMTITVWAGEHYYDEDAVERELTVEAKDPEALHTLVANCGKAVEIMAATAVEDRVANAVAKAVTEAGDEATPTP